MPEMNDDLLRLKKRIEKSMYRLFVSEADEDQDRLWMLERISDDRLKKLLRRLSVSSMHVLEVIHAHDGIKGIDIARDLGITKGAVSKITRNLLDHGLIRKEQRPNNLKEIYYSVTPLGAEVAEVHQAFHREQDEKATELMAGFDAASLEIVAGFLEKLADLRQSDSTY